MYHPFVVNTVIARVLNLFQTKSTEENGYKLLRAFFDLLAPTESDEIKVASTSFLQFASLHSLVAVIQHERKIYDSSQNNHLCAINAAKMDENVGEFNLAFLEASSATTAHYSNNICSKLAKKQLKTAIERMRNSKTEIRNKEHIINYFENANEDHVDSHYVPIYYEAPLSILTPVDICKIHAISPGTSTERAHQVQSQINRVYLLGTVSIILLFFIFLCIFFRWRSKMHS